MGFVFFFWIITPILYFTNTWYAQYLPILSSHAFDNTGAPYNVTRILTPNNALDEAKYEAYSPLFLPISFAIAYGSSFAVIPATLSHTFLYFRKQIFSVIRNRSLPSRRSDIHARLMSKYKVVPQWWYAVIFFGAFVFAIVPIEGWPSELPVWALVLALSIAFVHVVPLGMIGAISKYVILLSSMSVNSGGLFTDFH
jgi:OPT family oligopeptide transporter